MSHVILSIGSNINPKENIELCKKELESLENCENWIFSGYYYSLPDGFNSKNTFINIVAYFQTDLSPKEILKITQNIEENMERTRKEDGSWSDRTIDIDIILWDKKHIHEKDLIIPHPKWKNRHFVMNPFRELISNHRFIRNFFRY